MINIPSYISVRKIKKSTQYFSTNGTIRLGLYYPFTEDQPEMSACRVSLVIARPGAQ